MNIFLVCVALVVLSALQYRVILRGRWYIEKPFRIPNHWAGHATVGIAVVIILNHLFLGMPLDVFRTLFITFLAPFAFIYIASLRSWQIQTGTVPAILALLSDLNSKMQ